MDLTPSADIAGKPVCVVRDEFSLSALTQPTFLSRCLMGMPTISVPIGDPQSNRNPQLSTSGEYFGHTLLAGAHTFPKVCGWAEKERAIVLLPGSPPPFPSFPVTLK